MVDNANIPQVTGTREDRGKAIAEMGNQIIRINDQSYKVKSQSSDTLYDVTLTEIGWKCSCPDHVTRGVKCKHVFGVEFSFNLREQVKKSVVIQPIAVSDCPFCHSTNLKKFGIRHNKDYDIQKFYCKDCHQHFSYNIGFESMKHNPKAVTTALQLYFSGESLRHTKESLKLLGVKVSHQTIHNWIEKYTLLMKQYIDNLKPQVGDAWRADEVFIKVKGNMKYLFALMDDETRYWIAQEVANSKEKHDAKGLLHEAKEIAGKRPNTFITDGLQSYHDAFNKEFYTNKRPQSKHIRHIKLNGDMNNNKQERLNGEIRDREKVMRGLKSTDTPILDGYQIFHNYMKPHEALGGKTPAEMVGIKVEGDDKWLTLIQNACQQTKFDSLSKQT